MITFFLYFRLFNSLKITLGTYHQMNLMTRFESGSRKPTVHVHHWKIITRSKYHFKKFKSEYLRTLLRNEAFFHSRFVQLHSNHVRWYASKRLYQVSNWHIVTTFAGVRAWIISCLGEYKDTMPTLLIN